VVVVNNIEHHNVSLVGIVAGACILEHVVAGSVEGNDAIVVGAIEVHLVLSSRVVGENHYY
jgi:hypothetical protein